MLVLSRKVGERITIGDDVQIIITRIAGGRVTIGIDAPKQIAVRRDELISQRIDCQAERCVIEVTVGNGQDLRVPA